MIERCLPANCPPERTTDPIFGLILLVAAVWAVDLRAQVSAECATADCARAAAAASIDPVTPSALTQDLARVDGLRLQFVDALREFTAIQARPVGDDSVEKPPMSHLVRTLQEWDTALATMRTRAATGSRGADLDAALAVRYLGRLAIDEALEHLDAAIRDDSRRTDIRLIRAMALMRANRPQQALADLRAARSQAPDDPVTHYLEAQQASAQGRDSDAIQARRRLVRAIAQADASRAGRPGAGRFDRLELLRETTGVAPIFPRARYATGFALLLDGRLTDAVAELQRAAPEETGDNPGIAAALAAAGAALGRADATTAIAQLGAALKQWPESGDLHRVLGLACWIMGQQSEALTHLRQSRDLDPADEHARIALAEVFASAGRQAEAERELTDVLTAMPASGQARFRLAQLRLNAGDLPGAATLLRDILRLSPPIVGREHVLFLLGSTLVNVADFDGAGAAYTERVGVSPNSAVAHRQLAEVYFLQGRDDEALAEFTAARWLDAMDARAQAGVAQVRLRQEQYADAAAAAKAALAIDATLPEAQFVLGTALIRLGRQEEGRAQLASFAAQQAAAQQRGQVEFELDALRREAARLTAMPAEAIPLLERALALDPDAGRSHRELGLALLRGGAADRGRDHLERAQLIEPTADVAQQLADLYRRSNVPEASARHQADYERLQLRERAARAGAALGGWTH